jgi:hypothetical protein
MCNHCLDSQAYAATTFRLGPNIKLRTYERVRYQITALHHSVASECNDLYEIALENDDAPLVPLDWYGPYRLMHEEIVKILTSGTEFRIVHVRHHECDDPTENSECGHLEPLRDTSAF